MTSDHTAREAVADRTRGPLLATWAGRQWVDWAAAILILLSGMPPRVELALRHDLPLAGEEPQYQRYARHWALGEGAEPRDKAFPWHPLGSFTHRPPGYTLLVGTVLRATGPDDLQSVRLLQALLDCGSLLLLYALGIAVFGAWTGRAAGLASAMLMARYDFLMGFVARILTETFYLFLVLASLGLALLARRSRAALPAAIGGFLLGWATITRPAALFIAPCLLVWLATVPAAQRRRQLALAAACGLLLAIAPVTWRNWQLQGRFILIATNGGQVLHDSVARVEDLSDPEDFPSRDDLKRPGLGEVDQQRAYRDAALGYLRRHPEDWGKVLGRKLAILLVSKDEHTISHHPMPTPMDPWLYPLSLAGAGLSLLWRPRWRWHGRLLLLGGVGAQVAAFVIANAEVRYRVPLVPMLVLLGMGAGVGVGVMMWKAVRLPRRAQG